MLICANCGESNPERARFCLNCAAPLVATPAHVEERKVVTVLFCDPAFFTARAERSDPEDVRRWLDTYQSTLRREIERFEGSVLQKFIGDAVMAVFGAPSRTRTTPSAGSGRRCGSSPRWLSSTRSSPEWD